MEMPAREGCCRRRGRHRRWLVVTHDSREVASEGEGVVRGCWLSPTGRSVASMSLFSQEIGEKRHPGIKLWPSAEGRESHAGCVVEVGRVMSDEVWSRESGPLDLSE
jgi:hypothetical protein